MKYVATKLKSNQTRFSSIIFSFCLCTIFCHNTLLIAQDRPNVLIMLTDDQGYGDLGSHGNPYLKTPNIEKIGKQGLEMTHFFSYPNCSATRAAILTGRYPYRTGVTGVTQVDHFMNTSEETLAEILSKNGYRTGIFGKWHLGDNAPMRPTDQGFQEALVHKGGGIGQAAGPTGNTYFDPILEHNNEPKKYEGYCDDIFTDAALDFMSEKSDKPFFTYLATNLPHFPLEVPDEKADPYRKIGLHEDNAKTYGMIDNIDANVGRVLKRLKQLGIEDNTIVIFLSDNGPRNRRTKNDVYPGRWVANLRGTKTSVYECGTRVPFFVRWPKHIEKAQQNSTMGAVIDVLPTILDVCKIEASEDIKLDGKSLLPLWKGEKPDFKDREFIVQMHYGPTVFKYMHFAVRTQKYKLVSPHDDPHHILYQPKDEELKEVLANLELYDVENDPSERINLANNYPEIVEDLLARYENWFDEVTEERDSKGIQRIYLGSNMQRSTNLSQFDWGGPRVLSKNDLGHWRVKTESGTYNVSFDLPELNNEGVAHLKYKDVHLKLPVNKDQKKITFTDVILPEGTGNFHAFLKTERLATGPLFVDVERID
ncbi:arylsulfatase [Zobellia laminariae]|uniref:arylsulfatase n=1 Tax=Zobellia laminariae TaxID=248906 RepID=UPI0026F4297E|nr:arylsulfatase [Zobellia laminariae]WKX75136.1 arylsulfatase [Zobellia laminariae]